MSEVSVEALDQEEKMCPHISIEVRMCHRFLSVEHEYGFPLQ